MTVQLPALRDKHLRASIYMKVESHESGSFDDLQLMLVEGRARSKEGRRRSSPRSSSPSDGHFPRPSSLAACPPSPRPRTFLRLSNRLLPRSRLREGQTTRQLPPRRGRGRLQRPHSHPPTPSSSCPMAVRSTSSNRLPSVHSSPERDGQTCTSSS